MRVAHRQSSQKPQKCAVGTAPAEEDPEIHKAGITRVFGNRSGKLARNAVLLAALACAALSFGGKPQAALDVAVRAESGHALLRIGFASINLAFDFGQKCSESNACTGAIL
jgi:hypothetical protein